jgi:hypothetical protein
MCMPLSKKMDTDIVISGKSLDEWIQLLHSRGVITTTWNMIPLHKNTHAYDDLCAVVIKFFNIGAGNDAARLLHECLYENYIYRRDKCTEGNRGPKQISPRWYPHISVPYGELNDQQRSKLDDMICIMRAATHNKN